MKRTLNKLAHQRKEKEKSFNAQLDELKKRDQDLQKLLDAVPSIRETFQGQASTDTPAKTPEKKKGHPLPFLSRPAKHSEPVSLIQQSLLPSLEKIAQILEQSLVLNQKILSSFTTLMETTPELMDARDKEWDALGSNHVGKIFKSLEWRVDKLDAEAKDANLLLKKFILLEEKLNEMIGLLEEKKAPSPRLVDDLLTPLQDWRYTSFENRYRGSEEETSEQLRMYLPYFKKGGKVLDLGCGRGEFLALLHDNGIEAEGVDLNQQMIDICREKGLNCTNADILDKLTGIENGSLGGIFSAQVVEHMLPQYLKRVIALAYHKLAPSGSIVLETVNPASVFALVQIYFLDLSHRQPIHPQTLRFLLESSGFEDVELKFSSELRQEKLQDLSQTDEASTVINRNIDKLNDLLFSPPNYAAIGQKK